MKVFHPITNVTRNFFNFVLMEPLDRAAYVEEKLVVERILPICITFDHRFQDGAMASKMLSRIRHVMENPDKYF